MSLGGLGNTIQVLSAIFSNGGGAGLKREIIIEGPTGKLILPVTPAKYTVGDGQKNKVVDITQVGEALVFGMPKARTLSFSGFFPSLTHDYPFVVGDYTDPTACVEKLTEWKAARKAVRVIITDSPVNMMCGIMEFSYWEQDGSRDIYYTLNFTEYKELNVPTANNDKPIDDKTGLKVRPVDLDQKIKEEQSQISKGKALFQKACDVMDVAKKAYGDYNHWRRVVKSNNLKSLVINNAGRIRKWVIKN